MTITTDIASDKTMDAVEVLGTLEDVSDTLAEIDARTIKDPDAKVAVRDLKVAAKAAIKAQKAVVKASAAADKAAAKAAAKG